MPTDILTAQQNAKALQTEVSKLNASSLIELFEIDVSQIALAQGLSLPINEQVFRFHSYNKLLGSSITWQGNIFVAAPIQGSSWEISGKGTLPTPKLSISVNEAGISALSLLRAEILQLGDLVGAIVRRHRTFVKFLDASNFNADNMPKDLEPNPYIELPIDIYYINRKSNENKLIIEYELVSALDLQNLKLPSRQMIANQCPFIYRCEGCLYEYGGAPYAGRANDIALGANAILPYAAPAVATNDDQLIVDVLNINSITDRGQYMPGINYNIGDSVYIIAQDVNYYFVAKNNNVTTQPPDANNWIEDSCSKTINGCKIRWGISGSVNVVGTPLVKGNLPFGGFPSLLRVEGNYF